MKDEACTEIESEPNWDPDWSAPLRVDRSRGGFDRGSGGAILELGGAEIPQG
jgi:hypothetical protein